MSFLKVFIFLLISLVISINDIKTLSVSPCLILFGIIALSTISFFSNPKDKFFLDIFGAFFIAIIFIIVRKISAKGLGQGDIYVSSFCSLFCGFYAMFFSIIISCILCFIFFAIKIKKDKSQMQNPLPFTPFLFIGTLISKGFFN